MERMLSKLSTRIESMNTISMKVIKYGFFFFLFILFACVVAVILNKYAFGYNLEVSKKSMEVFRSSFSVLGITLIGGLVMDYISKKG